MKQSDGKEILLARKLTLLKTIDKKIYSKGYDKNNLYLPAMVRWFPMPSGRRWFCELDLNGEKLANYHQRYKDIKIMQHRYKYWYIQ